MVGMCTISIKRRRKKVIRMVEKSLSGKSIKLMGSGKNLLPNSRKAGESMGNYMVRKRK